MNHRWTIALALGLLVAWGCAETAPPGEPIQDPIVEPTTPTPTTPAPEAQPVDLPNDPVHASLGENAKVDLVPEGAIPEPYVRPRRRMDLDQLDATIRRVSGGIGWTEGKNDTNLFVQLSETLDKPDYIEFTSEDLSASTLFQKFLGDAARSVCTKIIDRELNDSEAERILMKHVEPTDTLESAPEAVAKNLRDLQLLFHGRIVPEGTPDPALNTWQWLFESATLLTNDPAQGWRTVCVGMMTHPFFYSH